MYGLHYAVLSLNSRVRGGRDTPDGLSLAHHIRFNSRVRGGRDKFVAAYQAGDVVSTHASAGDATFVFLRTAQERNCFNSRVRGGRDCFPGP